MVELPGGLSLEDFLLACREEPSWFVQWVTGRPNAVLHNELQDFLTGTADGYVELPRGHGKTTQLSARYAWEIGRNPSVRITNVGSSDEESVKTVGAVRTLIESEAYRMVFPEVVPDKRWWGKESFRVERPSMDRDPTMQAASIFGRAGTRSDILGVDDICDMKNALQQPALREQVKDFYRSVWLPTVDVSRPGSRVWRFATPWHIEDVTADWRGEFGPVSALFRRPCVGSASPWPEVYTPDVLEARRASLGPMAYARAYELKPISSDELVFPAEWLDRSMYKLSGYSQSTRDGGVRIGAVDFAFSKKTLEKPDPDWSVFLVGVRDLSGTLWLERLWRVRMTFPEFAKLVSSNARALGVRTVIAESNGPQAGLVQQLRSVVGCAVTDALRVKDKYSRACEKQWFVESGRLRLPRGEDGDVLRELRPLYDEVTTFPGAGKDDLTDAMIDLITLSERSGYGSSALGGGGGVGNVSSGRDRLWRFGYR